MGIAAIVVSAIVAPIAIIGVVKGIQYLVKISREKNKTEIATKNTGENLDILNNELQDNFKENKMKIDNEEELSNTIKEIKNDKVNQYNMKVIITKEDNSIYHLEEEISNLNTINNTFGKSYTFSSEIIDIKNKKLFDDLFFKKLMRIKWENLTELILTHNNITQISPLTTNPLINLYKLDLSYNLLEEIDNFPLTNMLKLSHVNLRNNKIDSPFIFIQLCGLKYLNLINNKFDEKDKERFIKKFKKNNPNAELII